MVVMIFSANISNVMIQIGTKKGSQRTSRTVDLEKPTLRLFFNFQLDRIGEFFISVKLSLVEDYCLFGALFGGIS